jgi:hypothetical protein
MLNEEYTHKVNLLLKTAWLSYIEYDNVMYSGAQRILDRERSTEFKVWHYLRKIGKGAKA